MKVSVEGVEKILGRFQNRKSRAQRAARRRCVVGYSAPYAVHVHEDLEAFHANGQAKFLEQPAREFKGEMAAYVRGATRRGQTVEQAQLGAGQILLAESQKLVPVLTGFLKRSGFARMEEG
jgi:hypothetical protein